MSDCTPFFPEPLLHPLEAYVAKNLSKVRLLRLPTRKGLIAARLVGAAAAKAPVLTFLDSHCECSPGWLEPLLQRVHTNEHAVVCPVIDVVDSHSLAYKDLGNPMAFIGGFNWKLNFRWDPLPPRLSALKDK